MDPDKLQLEDDETKILVLLKLKQFISLDEEKRGQLFENLNYTANFNLRSGQQVSRQLNQRKSSQLEGEGHDDYENQETEKKTRTN